MMKKMIGITSLFAAAMALFACSQKKETNLPVPANEKAVYDFVQGKKLTVQSVGFYDNLSFNDVKEVKWLDIQKEENTMIVEVATEEMSLGMHFINDTAVTVSKKGKEFAGTYKIITTTEPKDEEPAGIQLKLSYADPESGFGGELMNVTYTYIVLGLDNKKLLLQMPRTINRQNLLALMSE